MPALIHKGYRIPKDVADALDGKPNATEYVVAAVREKMARDEQAAMSEGFALLADSPEVWDMDLPTGGQQAAGALFDREKALDAP